MRTPGSPTWTPTSANIVQLSATPRALAGRSRMKGSTRLKNQGYHLEHNFGHGDQHLSEAFFDPQPASVLHARSIFELVDGLYQGRRYRTLLAVPAARSGRGALRLPKLFLFTSWATCSVLMSEPPRRTGAPLSVDRRRECLSRTRRRESCSPARVPTTTMPHHLRQGSPCALPPAAARSTEPHPESARLRRLARSVPVPRLTWPCRRSQPFSFRPSTAVHRESLVIHRLTFSLTGVTL